MKREIKFRGKVPNGVWVYGFYTYDSYGGADLIDVIERAPELRQYNILVNGETVGQYTGLRDKNGKEIYKGDIFHLGDVNIKYVVEWIDCGLRGSQITNRSSVGLTYWQDKIEIIGNIYENPELIKTI